MRTSSLRFNSDPSELEDLRGYMERTAKEFLDLVPSFEGPLQYTEEIGKMARWVVEGKKTSLLIMGQTGCGKTILAKTLGRTIAVRNLCPCFISMTKLAALSRKNEEVPEFVYEERTVILDDLGTEPSEIQMYGNRYQLFNEILYARYSRFLPTVITTNLGWEDLERKYEKRVISRMREMFDVLVLKGGDLRK